MLTLIAAILHDTAEDTETTEQEIRDEFDDAIADIVMECTDDKSLPKAERKRLQIVNAPHKMPRSKLVKSSDKLCNVRSLVAYAPIGWDAQRCLEYFDWAEQVYAGLRGQNALLDTWFDEAIANGRKVYAPAE